MPRPSRFDEIVAVSGRVFKEKGFDGARLEDIAQEVGIWKGSLYHYIDSKEDLLFAVVREPAERILEETRALVGRELEPEEKLRQLARLHVSVLASAQPFAAVYIEEIAGKHRFKEWETKDREYALMVEEIVGDVIGKSRDGVSTRVAARAFIGSLNWMTRWYRFDGSLDTETVADEIAEVFLRGLAAAKGSTKPTKRAKPAKAAKQAKAAKRAKPKAAGKAAPKKAAPRKREGARKRADGKKS